VQEKGASLSADDRQQVKQAIREKIAAKDFAEWNAIFQAQDVCVEPVLTLHEALHSELAAQRGWIAAVPLSAGSEETEPQPACPIKFSRSKIRYEFIGKKLGEDCL